MKKKRMDGKMSSKFTQLARRIIAKNKIKLKVKSVKVDAPKRKILAKQVKPVKSGFWKH